MIKRIIGLLFIVLLTFACSKKKGAGPNSGPGAATLLTPLKDQPCLTGTAITTTESGVAFSWTGGQNADSYELNIKNLLTQIVITQQILGTKATITLLRNTPYSWYVTSKSGSTTGAKSDIWKFYNAGEGVITYAPFPTEIVAPTLGQLIVPVNGKINLSWKGNAVSGKITGYNVYFGPSNNPDLFRTMITDNFINDITVSANTTYYWHVVTVDSNNNVADSGLFNFFVKQ